MSENKELEPVKNRPLRGRGGTHNFPSAKFQVTDENRAIVKQLLTETLNAYTQPKVKTDEELAERLSNYFEMCAERGQIPTVEEMCLYTGHGSAVCYDWETGRTKGLGSQSGSIIKKAKEYMKTFDAKLVIAGQQNPIVYFFRAKNYYGMHDNQDIIITPAHQEENDFDAEDIRRRYLSDYQPPIDVTDSVPNSET